MKFSVYLNKHVFIIVLRYSADVVKLRSFLDSGAFAIENRVLFKATKKRRVRDVVLFLLFLINRLHHTESFFLSIDFFVIPKK